MQGIQKLNYFTRIIWIDRNPLVQIQLFTFISVFGEQQILFFSNAKQALELVKCASSQKFIIICSSRLIQQVHSCFKNEFNCYPKYLVFCGSGARCQQVRNKYSEIVQRAEFNQDNIITSIRDIQSFVKNRQSLYKMSIKWILVENQTIQSISSSENYKKFLLKLEYKDFKKYQFINEEEINNKHEQGENKRVLYIIKFEGEDNKENLPKYCEALQKLRQKYKNILKFIIIDQSEMQDDQEQELQQFTEFCERFYSIESAQYAINGLY